MKRKLPITGLLFFLILLFSYSSSYAQTELIVNGGADNNRVPPDGQIVGWTFENGTSWGAVEPSLFFTGTPRSAPYVFIPFSTETDDSWRIAQTVDVSAYSGAIDNGSAVVAFSGFIQSDNGSDASNIIVSFFDGSDGLITAFVSSTINSTSWTEVSDSRTVPSDTRSIEVALLAEDNDGDLFADILIDDISLTITINSSPPAVTTTTVSSFDATSATLGGEVTYDGEQNVSERGIVWNTTGAPELTDNRVPIGLGTGTFSQVVDLLPFGTSINVRAYATNSEGTSYGNEIEFTTSSTVSLDLTDGGDGIGGEGWRLLSVPALVTFSDFLEPIWTQGASGGGGDTGAGTPNVYRWSTLASGRDASGWSAVTNLDTNIGFGRGFLVLVYEDPDFDGPTEPGLPQTLSVTGSEYDLAISPVTNLIPSGWTLLGNPFASPIDFDGLSTNNFTETIYVWDPNSESGDGGTEPNQGTGSWKTWNGSSGDVTGGRIAPFQGFFVQNGVFSMPDRPEVFFTQDNKTSISAPFLGKEQEIPFVRLELQGQGMRNSAWLELSPDGADEHTAGDAWELTPLSEHYASLATRKPDGSLLDIARYAFGDLQIPLVTDATRPGAYQLTITDATATGLYLNDMQTRTSMPLEQGLAVEFELNSPAKAVPDPFARIHGGLKKTAPQAGARFVISDTPLQIQRDAETPQAFALQQNYPNPFNPATVIRYQLPRASQVRLEVFDLNGRAVATLVEARQPAGTYSVNFDGSELSSGVYMYRLQAGDAVFTRKLTLIK